MNALIFVQHIRHVSSVSEKNLLSLVNTSQKISHTFSHVKKDKKIYSGYIFLLFYCLYYFLFSQTFVARCSELISQLSRRHIRTTYNNPYLLLEVVYGQLSPYDTLPLAFPDPFTIYC